MKKQNTAGHNSLPSVFIPEVAGLAYFRADSTALPLVPGLVLVGHQRHGCLHALAGPL